MTSATCPTGTDRAHEAVQKLGQTYDFVVNLQGDAPLTPPDFITEMIRAYDADPSIDVITPIVALRWDELDALRAAKQHTPFSGTCVVVGLHDEAIWFSKQIIPAIRHEAGPASGE